MTVTITDRPPVASVQHGVWSATLTVASTSTGVRRGCSDVLLALGDCSGALTDNDFTFEGTAYEVDQVVLRRSALTLNFDQAVAGSNRLAGRGSSTSTAGCST